MRLQACTDASKQTSDGCKLYRAMLKDAIIIALDEATASLDKGTDSLIQATLKDLLASSPQR